MKKKLITLFVLALTILIVWIDLPENYTLKFNLGTFKVDTKINPLSIDTDIFGLKIKKNFVTKLGLDLKGGSRLVFEADMRSIKKEDREDALLATRDTMERRVNFFGVSEPNVQTVKNGADFYRINVELPGIENSADAISIIGQIAKLEFYEEASGDAKIASGSSIYEKLTKPTGLTGKFIKKSTVQFDSNTGNPNVALEFNEEGAKMFEDITRRNVGKPVAIYLDNYILSAPTVQGVIVGGSAEINGKFSVDEAKKLAVAINSGSLPVPVKLIEQRNIGATLGEDQIKKSIFAGIAGLAAVIIFMVAYYGRLGMIASLALLIYALISLAIFRAIPVVMTLSGVAGFILSIGMAVDTNILIFERIKEERRKGKDFDVAIRLGFGRAIEAIKDANFTTLIVAFILFNPLNWEFLPQFGLIKGFALTLAIGVATSLFTGVFITKRLINIFYKKA